jgi:hypothetical protein
MKRLSQQDWILRANIVHNYKYNYYNVNYVSGKKKVVIICPEHGEFLQRADNHLFLKRGCMSCGNSTPFTLSSWIEKSNKIHNNFYNYSKVDFKSIKGKVIIICPIHGEFSQIAEKHLYGGCRGCANNKPFDLQKFLDKAHQIHNNYYDYSLIKIVNNTTSKLPINCPKHGLFWQNIKNHLKGKKCLRCSNGNSSKKEKLWLDICSVPNDPLHRNVKIIINNKTYKVDGFFKKEKIIYEFLGDFWHGHPKKYNPILCNKVSNKTFSSLFTNTVQRIRLFRANGYKVISIWESIFDKKYGKLK